MEIVQDMSCSMYCPFDCYRKNTHCHDSFTYSGGPFNRGDMKVLELQCLPYAVECGWFER